MWGCLNGNTPAENKIKGTNRNKDKGIMSTCFFPPVLYLLWSNLLFLSWDQLLNGCVPSPQDFSLSSCSHLHLWNLHWGELTIDKPACCHRSLRADLERQKATHGASAGTARKGVIFVISFRKCYTIEFELAVDLCMALFLHSCGAAQAPTRDFI